MRWTRPPPTRSSWRRGRTGSRARRRPPTADPTPDSAADDDAPETGPQRRCLVTRQSGERAEMLRFVLGPDRVVVADLGARLPGRGMWLSARADVIEAARARGAFARAARGPVTVPAELLSVVRAGLARRVTEQLGLARRAGQAVCGFTKAREWLLAGRVALVVHASDGSAEECARLLSGARDVAVVAPMTASALGAVFGRDHAVHVAIAPGRLAEGLRAESMRLAGVSGGATGAVSPVGLHGRVPRVGK